MGDARRERETGSTPCTESKAKRGEAARVTRSQLASYLQTPPATGVWTFVNSQPRAVVDTGNTLLGRARVPGLLSRVASLLEKASRSGHSRPILRQSLLNSVSVPPVWCWIFFSLTLRLRILVRCLFVDTPQMSEHSLVMSFEAEKGYSVVWEPLQDT
ncbi:hypothetical protein BaRGS_00015776 [Batillaria attramentaria]|uniref:Uncharacterized protein n=1 Tax=Batillaria attramentaria TaxID=370345 RepID=A0ABD0L0I3_9CAEN